MPNGTSGIGASGNQNVGIGVTTPIAKLDLSTNPTTGGLRIMGTNTQGVGGEGNIVSTPYAIKLDFNETQSMYGGNSITTFALLDPFGKLFLGDFNNTYNSNHSLNTKAEGIAVFGAGTNKLTATYSGTHGNLISWTTNNTAPATRNLGFAYGTNAPFFFLTPEGKAAIGTTNTSGVGHLHLGSNGFAINGLGGNRLIARFDAGYGSQFSWSTDNQTVGASRNLSFSYATNAPFFSLTPEGKVAIATTKTNGDYKLFIGGKGIAEELVVRLQADWPDYVFTSDYDMLSNNELRQYITKNGKLPYLPAASEVAETGLALGETQAQLTRLVEELTLRLLQMEERIEELEQELAK